MIALPSQPQPPSTQTPYHTTCGLIGIYPVSILAETFQLFFSDKACQPQSRILVQQSNRGGTSAKRSRRDMPHSSSGEDSKAIIKGGRTIENGSRGKKEKKSSRAAQRSKKDKKSRDAKQAKDAESAKPAKEHMGQSKCAKTCEGAYWGDLATISMQLLTDKPAAVAELPVSLSPDDSSPRKTDKSCSRSLTPLVRRSLKKQREAASPPSNPAMPQESATSLAVAKKTKVAIARKTAVAAAFPGSNPAAVLNNLTSEETQIQEDLATADHKFIEVKKEVFDYLVAEIGITNTIYPNADGTQADTAMSALASQLAAVRWEKQNIGELETRLPDPGALPPKARPRRPPSRPALVQPPTQPKARPRPPASSSNSTQVVLTEQPNARSHTNEAILLSKQSLQRKLYNVEFGDRLYHLGDAPNMVCGLEHDLKPRKAYSPKQEALEANPQSRTPAVQPAESPRGQLQSPMIGTIMVGTWVIGKQCEPGTLAKELARTGLDVLILVKSTALATCEQEEPIHEFLCRLTETAQATSADAAPEPLRENVDPRIGSVGDNKKVMRIGKNTFVVVNKSKVTAAYVQTVRLRPPGDIPYRGPCDPVGLWFVVLKLNERQKYKNVRVGIIEKRGCMHAKTVAAVAECVKIENFDMLTGFFGTNCQEWVSNLATQTHAISYTPFYQCFKLQIGKSYFHPSFFLVYAYYREVDIPSAAPDWDPQDIDSHWDDITQDMVPVTDAPQWKRNDYGSVNAQNFVKIKMRHDFKRWFPGCFQTFMWLGNGRSTPGQGSIDRSRNRHAQHIAHRVPSYSHAAASASTASGHPQSRHNQQDDWRGGSAGSWSYSA